MKIQLLFLVVILVSLTEARRRGRNRHRPRIPQVEEEGEGNGGPCQPDHVTDDQRRTIQMIESGKLSVATALSNYQQRSKRSGISCEDGPQQVIYTAHNEFYCPPIFKGTCKNLPCEVSRCLTKESVIMHKCVYVIRRLGRQWHPVGWRLRTYRDDLSCECFQCKHINNRHRCISTRPCPNGEPHSYCFWNQTTPCKGAVQTHSRGKCACCEPMECLPPKLFNRRKCTCECPRGTVEDSNGNCVGDCKRVDLRGCPDVYCKDNPNLRCIRDRCGCRCPTCKDVPALPKICPTTKCINQPNKPYCLLDTVNNKCRCPSCHHQNTQEECDDIYCGHQLRLKCKWDTGFRKCFCPCTTLPQYRRRAYQGLFTGEPPCPGCGGEEDTEEEEGLLEGEEEEGQGEDEDGLAEGEQAETQTEEPERLAIGQAILEDQVENGTRKQYTT